MANRIVLNETSYHGAGFGKNGEGFFRLTAFGGAGSTVEAAQRLLKLK